MAACSVRIWRAKASKQPHEWQAPAYAAGKNVFNTLVVFIIFSLVTIPAYGTIGPKTAPTQDSLAPVSGHFRHQDILALVLRVRTIGPDTSVLGPGHFGTSAKVSSYCDRMVKSRWDRKLTTEAL